MVGSHGARVLAPVINKLITIILASNGSMFFVSDGHMLANLPSVCAGLRVQCISAK